MCFVCQQERPFTDALAVEVDGHQLKRCACGMVVAVSLNGAAPYDFSDYGDYLIDFDLAQRLRWTRTANARLFRSFSHDYGPKASILDVGAGAGFFVRTARDFGFVAEGVEPSEKLRAYSASHLGIELAAKLDDFGSTKFEAICLFDVIEHVPPEASRTLIGSLVSRLNPGGSLVGNTPNFRSANILIRKERDPVIWPPSHVCYFTRETLDSYFRSFGLRRKELYTEGFVAFRRNKKRFAFVERGGYSLPFKISVLYPLKIALYAAGKLCRPPGLGYEIYFQYIKHSAST